MMICCLEKCSDNGPVGLGERCLQTWWWDMLVSQFWCDNWAPHPKLAWWAFQFASLRKSQAGTASWPGCHGSLGRMGLVSHWSLGGLAPKTLPHPEPKRWQIIMAWQNQMVLPALWSCQLGEMPPTLPASSRLHSSTNFLLRFHWKETVPLCVSSILFSGTLVRPPNHESVEKNLKPQLIGIELPKNIPWLQKFQVINKA